MMPSPAAVRCWITSLLPALLVGAAATSQAQSTYRATVRTTVSVAVPGVAGVVAVAAPRLRARRASHVDISAIVVVKANGPYTLSAWMPTTALAQADVRVWVRDAEGVFRLLDGDASVSVVERGAPGPRRQTEVVYRIEANNPSALSRIASMALRYDAMPYRPPMAGTDMVATGGGF